MHMMNEINPLPHVRAGKLTLLNINHPSAVPIARHADADGAGYTDADVPIWYAICAPPAPDRDRRTS